MTRPDKGALVSLNVALKLHDGFTGNPIASGQISFELDGISCVPAEKRDGIFAFTDYVDRFLPHIMRITCKGYCNVEIPILPILSSSVLADAVQVLALQPNLDYSYPNEVTLICGRIVVSREMHIADVVASIVVDGRRGAACPALDGHYRIAIKELAENGTRAELDFMSRGQVLARKSVLVTSGQSTTVDDVVLTT